MNNRTIRAGLDASLGNVSSVNTLTFAGPTAARIITVPDAAFTVARTDAANTFNGTQTFNGAVGVTGVATFTASAVASLGVRTVPTAIAVDGAITIRPGTVYATKAGVLAMTLATPTVGTHDGIRIKVIATTANANTITCAAGKLGGSAVATFGGAVNDFVEVEAYQGIWYPAGEKNITYS